MRRSLCLILVALALGACLPVAPVSGAGQVTKPADGLEVGRLPVGLWLSVDEVRALPMTGAGWENVQKWAQEPWGAAAIADQDSFHDQHVLAGALVAVRTGDVAMGARVVTGLRDAMGTEAGARSLAVARNLLGYVVAADLIGYRDAGFVAWLSAIRTRDFDGRTLVSTHEQRPNNWGAHAGASRVAISRFVGDSADVKRAAQVFAGYLGDRSAYDGFVFGNMDWQADPSAPVGVNPRGAQRDGRSVDGVLPEEMRRSGAFTWPPPHENYAWEGLGGLLAQGWLLHRAGYPAFEWSDRALLRAATWLHDQARFPAEGDDRWQPWLLNHVYGTTFPATGGGVGKAMAFADWTHPTR